jgi:hypothetical protein
VTSRKKKRKEKKQSGVQSDVFFLYSKRYSPPGRNLREDSADEIQNKKKKEERKELRMKSTFWK